MAKKKINRDLILKQTIILRETYMCKLRNDYIKLLIKHVELWFLKRKMVYNEKRYKRRYKNGKVRKR